MPTAPTHVTPYSGIPPSSADPANFDARADAKVAEDAAKVDEFNDLADNCYANALEAYTSAVAAGTQRTGAEAAALAAAASANTAAASAAAIPWVSGAVVNNGQRVIDPDNQQVYWRTSATGSGVTAPHLDDANYRRVRIEADLQTARSYFLT